MNSQSNVGDASSGHSAEPAKGCVCPSCKRAIYNRRLPKCGFCGATIPEELRFTPGQSEVIDRKLERLERVRRERENPPGDAADYADTSWERPPAPIGGCVCPACKRSIYNRRLMKRGFCGATIPEELRFTPSQIEAMDRELEKLEDARRQREAAADEAAKEAAQAVTFPPIIFPMG